jgi:hypothetical protein
LHAVARLRHLSAAASELGGIYDPRFGVSIRLTCASLYAVAGKL